MAGNSSTQPGSRLDWMYQGPGGHVSREEYLLGRKVDASLDLLNKEDDKDKVPPKTTNQIEYDIIPESIARRRPEDTSAVQVDMKRKLLEDPLLAIRKREELTRREITSNPVKRKQLELLVRSIQNLSSSSSSDSDSDDSSKKKKHKKQKRKHKKHKSDKSSKKRKNKKSKTKDVQSPVQDHSNKHSNHEKRSPDVRHHKETIRDSSQCREKQYIESHNRHASNCEEKRHRDISSHGSRSFNHQSHIPDRKDQKFNHQNEDVYRSRRKRSRSPYDRDPPRKVNKLSQADMDRKRQEMMQSAVSRDQQRRENVKRYDEERKKEEQNY